MRAAVTLSAPFVAEIVIGRSRTGDLSGLDGKDFGGFSTLENFTDGGTVTDPELLTSLTTVSSSGAGKASCTRPNVLPPPGTSEISGIMIRVEIGSRERVESWVS